MYQILHRKTKTVLGSGDDLYAAIASAKGNLNSADLSNCVISSNKLIREGLRGTKLCGVDFRGADLTGVDFRGTNLCCSDLRGADLRDSKLCGVDLRGAYLRNVDLRDAELYWGSRELIAEILRQDAGEDVEKLKYAGFVLIHCDKYWFDCIKLDDPLQSWAVEVLNQWDGCPLAVE